MNDSGLPSVGILYPGEMGTALGKLLRQKGHRVATTLAGRSPRTQRTCRDAGLEVLESLADVARTADLVMSLVPPAAATAVAEDYCSCKPHGAFVDLNSISPVTALRIGEICSDAGVEFVDGAVHGLAAQLSARGLVFLSGPRAPWVAETFEGMLRTRVLSAAVGDASTFRLLLSGISKGVIALFVEASLTAERAGLLEPLLACYRDIYPGVMSIVERILPTYPQHAVRRADEMREAEQMMKHLDLQPHMMTAAREVIAAVGHAGLADDFPERGADWSIADIVKELLKREVLEEQIA